MEEITITEGAMEGPSLGIEVLWGMTPAQATDAQPALFNSGTEPLTITLAPGTGVFVRMAEKTP